MHNFSEKKVSTNVILRKKRPEHANFCAKTVIFVQKTLKMCKFNFCTKITKWHVAQFGEFYCIKRARKFYGKCGLS